MSQPPATPSSKIVQTLDRSERFPYPRWDYVRRALWNLCYYTIWRIPRAWRLRRAIIRLFGGKVGQATIFRASCRIIHPWLLQIGDFCSIADGATVYNLGPITIGSHTTISQGTYLCAGTHDYTLAHMPLRRPPITIGSGVWVAAEAFIGPGAVIGDNTVVGARAVVMGTVPAGVVVAGNPARVVKDRVMKDEKS